MQGKLKLDNAKIEIKAALRKRGLFVGAIKNYTHKKEIKFHTKINSKTIERLPKNVVTIDKDSGMWVAKVVISNYETYNCQDVVIYLRESDNLDNFVDNFLLTFKEAIFKRGE